MPTARELFSQVEDEPLKCGCGKDLVFAEANGRLALAACPCGAAPPETLPEFILIGMSSGGPMWIYPKRRSR